jgi:hypothetical protein
MSKQVNNLKQGPKSKSSKHPKMGRGFARGTHMVLNGAFLDQRNSSIWLSVIFFLAFLGLIYISNSYLAEKKIRKIEKINKNIKELKFEYVQVRANLMEESRPSVVAQKLEKYGIRPIVEPPNKIFLKTNN